MVGLNNRYAVDGLSVAQWVQIASKSGTNCSQLLFVGVHVLALHHTARMRDVLIPSYSRHVHVEFMNTDTAITMYVYVCMYACTYVAGWPRS